MDFRIWFGIFGFERSKKSLYLVTTPKFLCKSVCDVGVFGQIERSLFINIAISWKDGHLYSTRQIFKV